MEEPLVIDAFRNQGYCIEIDFHKGDGVEIKDFGALTIDATLPELFEEGDRVSVMDLVFTCIGTEEVEIEDDGSSCYLYYFSFSDNEEDKH